MKGVFSLYWILLKWQKKMNDLLCHCLDFMIKLDLRVVKDVYFCPEFFHYHIGPSRNV